MINNTMMIEQTPAVMALRSQLGGTARASGRKRSRGRKKKAAAAAPAARRRKAKSGKTGSRLVAGSAAAKAWGKKMRAAQRKRK